MPDGLKKCMVCTRSFKTNGIPFTGEGADFKLEALNKNVQKWVTGNATEAEWTTVCRNHDKLRLLREKLEKEMGLEEEESSDIRIPCDISQQSNVFRTRLREKSYLTLPYMQTTHVSMKGVELDRDLHLFSKTATRKQNVFYENFLENHHMIQNHQSIPFNEAPVFVTKDERDQYEAIESKGAEYILQKCKSMIDSIDNDEDRDDFGDDYKVAAKPSTKKY